VAKLQFASVRELLDYLTTQLIDIRAEALATRAAAGIAMGLLIQNSANPAQSLEAFRQQARSALKDVKVLGRDPESDEKLLRQARASLDQLCNGLAGAAKPQGH